MPLRASARPFGLLAAVVLVVGCSSEAPGGAVRSEGTPDETAVAAPSPTPSPTPAAPTPVEGHVELTALHLESAGQRLYPAGHPEDAPPPVDEAAVHAFVGAVADRLDAHLDALQRGEAGTLLATLEPAAAAPEAAAAITTDLASPDDPVLGAIYTTEVAVDGTPAWAHVTVTVTHPDGSTGMADLVFVATDAGPELVAAGPAGEVA